MKEKRPLQILGMAIGLTVVTACALPSNPISPTPQPTPAALSAAAVTPAPTAVSREEAPQPVQSLTGHADSVTHLVFSRSGKVLVSGSDDGSVVLWDVANLSAPARVGRLPGDDKVRSLALSPDGNVLVISTSSGDPPPMRIYVWDVSVPEAPVLVAEPPPVMGGFVVMYSLAFSPDGRILAIGSEDRTITLWDMTDPATPVPLGPPLEGDRSGILRAVFSPDGKTLASGDTDGVITLWDVTDPGAPEKLATIRDQEEAVSAVAFSPDGKTLATGGTSAVHLRDAERGETLTVLEGLPTVDEYGVGVSLDFSPDGTMLATISGKTTLLWDVSDPKAPVRLDEWRRTDHGYSVAFSSDGKTLATGSGDGAIMLSDVSKASVAAQLSTPSAPVPLPAVEWPVSPLTQQQIAEVEACEVETLVGERYPDTLTTDDLQSVFAPQSGCDWAILALAYANRLEDGEELSEPARGAFSHAVHRNAGFALATPIFYRFFGSTPLVKPPAFAQQEITDINIKYDWDGLGDPVAYALEIHQANTTPTLSVTPGEYSASVHTEIPTETVQALAPALTDLLPIGSKFTLSPCTDNYPDWSVALTFADGTTVNLTTDSNALGLGGPWFTEMDEQSYIQVSSAFAEALGELVTAAGLPVGAPEAMSCFLDSVFDKAFP